MTIRAATGSPEGTKHLGQALGGCLDVGDVLSLNGDLGAGKTMLTKGIAQSLGISDPVTSPTFTLANEYRGRAPFYHLDVYRLSGPDEAYDLDVAELVESGITVIEWGDIIAPELPADVLRIELTVIPEPTVAPELDANPEPTASDGAAGEEWLAVDTGRLVVLAGTGTRWKQRWPSLVTALAPWAGPPAGVPIDQDDDYFGDGRRVHNPQGRPC